MKQTLTSRLMRKFQPKPAREAQPVVRYLRSDECTTEPRTLAEVVNNVTDLVELLQDFSELEPLMDRLEACSEEFPPGYPPAGLVTLTFFNYLLYFGSPYGNHKETLGSVCLELVRVFSIHPLRLRMLEALCQSRIGWFIQECRQGERVKLRELSTGRTVEAEVEVTYRGEAGEVWLGCWVDWDGGRWTTTPYVLRGVEPEALPRPKSWTTWLEWIQSGYLEHTSEAIFLAPPEADLPDAPEGCMSLAERWSPAVIQESEEAEPIRPRLLLLVDEAGPRVQAFDQQLQPYTQEQILGWLEKQSPSPKELWVEDAALHSYLSRTWKRGTCLLQQSLPRLHSAWQSLSRSLGSEENSLVELLGPRLALRFFESARNFFDRTPWQRLTTEDCLVYEDREGVIWGVVVMGSGGEEFGLAFYGSPEEAEAAIAGEMILPVLSFGLADVWLVPAQDLDLMDRSQLSFQNGEYPWLCYRPGNPRPTEARHAHLVHWLLQRIPEFIENGCAEVAVDGCYLALEGPMGDPDEMMKELLLSSWGKKSRQAELLAELMMEFLREEPKGPHMLEVIPRLISIGQDYLEQHRRKRSLVLSYFSGSAGLDSVARRLSAFVKRTHAKA